MALHLISAIKIQFMTIYYFEGQNSFNVSTRFQSNPCGGLCERTRYYFASALCICFQIAAWNEKNKQMTDRRMNGGNKRRRNIEEEEEEEEDNGGKRG